MRYAKWIVHSVLLFTVPSVALSPQARPPVRTIQNQEPLQIASSLSYDDILHLIEDLESGELEKRCSEADLERVNHFFANLARQGVLPNEMEEAFVLENDIQELLYGEDNSYEYPFSFDEENDYLLIPAFLYGQGEVVLCKSWIHKKWDQAKHFVKKHKKAIIIAAAAVVAAAVVVGIVAAVSAASAAAAGAAASGSEGEEKKDEPASAPPTSSEPPLDPSSEASNLNVEEQISSFKESVAKEHFFQTSDNSTQQGELSLEENGRALGSLFAHESIPKGTSDTALDFGHREIDQKFATDYASLYADPNVDTDFTTLVFQIRGEKALESGYLQQAVQDFGRAIELGSTSPLPYLERGVAYFGLGDYDRSLEDYRQYTSQTPKTHSLSVSDFSLGFAKGLPKGIYDSGEGLFLFLSDLVTHPVHTGAQMWDALTLLSKLVSSEQWDALSELLAPEVCHLVTEWDTLPSNERGELAGYAFGKYGSDIAIPGTLAKAFSSGLKGAQEISRVCKSLQTVEQNLLLESVAGLENSEKIREFIQNTHRTATLADELGFTTRDMAQLKRAGSLEQTLATTFENIANQPALLKSVQRFKKAEAFLEPYSKGFMSETQAKELIRQAGIQTFSRPEGIPESFRVKLSNNGAGMKYVHPKNDQTYVRVMPGKPHSPFPNQQKPYVVQMKDGKTFDKFGNVVLSNSPEAHIPLEEFIYRD